MINIEEIKDKIVKQLKPINPKKIILFGSFAYGKPNEDSDLDICVIREDYQNKWKDKLKIRELLNNIKIPIDILNPKIDEYEFYSKEINSVYYDIEKQGVVLWTENS